jgi:hypothetical protein
MCALRLSLRLPARGRRERLAVRSIKEFERKSNDDIKGEGAAKFTPPVATAPTERIMIIRWINGTVFRWPCILFHKS